LLLLLLLTLLLPLGVPTLPLVDCCWTTAAGQLDCCWTA